MANVIAKNNIRQYHYLVSVIDMKGYYTAISDLEKEIVNKMGGIFSGCKLFEGRHDDRKKIEDRINHCQIPFNITVTFVYDLDTMIANEYVYINNLSF